MEFINPLAVQAVASELRILNIPDVVEIGFGNQDFL